MKFFGANNRREIKRKKERGREERKLKAVDN